MTIKQRIRSLSDFTKKLLGGGETHEVDFKKIPKGVSTEDLVAFANSTGGQILVGVAEASQDGAQVGQVIGCDVTDSAILEILNKASSCIPPVALDVFIENLSGDAILRIAIPPSETRPHCTPKGVYCRREGTRTRPLHPQEMLNVFLETEARSFAEKFEAAAAKVSKDLEELESSLEASIKKMGDQLGWAEFKLGDTEDTVDRILAYVVRIEQEARDANTRLRALFREDDRRDPVRERYRQKLIADFMERIVAEPKLLKAALEGQNLSGTQQGIYATELTEEEFEKAMGEAIMAIRDEIDRRKYSSAIRSPSECSEKQIDRFVELVSLGGEVAGGVRDRIMRAKALGFVEYDGVPVGVGAIKRPLKSYKKKVFEAARTPLDPNEFSIELGWIYLKENHRGKGQITPIIKEMLDSVKDRAIFATTRSSNVVMQEILKHFGFKKSGKAYRSQQNPDEHIQLQIKIPSKK